MIADERVFLVKYGNYLVYTQPPILKAKCFHLSLTDLKRWRSVLCLGEEESSLQGREWRGWCICGLHYAEYSALRLLHAPQPVPSLGTLFPVTCTFLNLMGSFVYYGFPIAGMDQGSDEWFIRKAAQGKLHGYYSSTLIRKSKGLVVPGREREGH